MSDPFFTSLTASADSALRQNLWRLSKDERICAELVCNKFLVALYSGLGPKEAMVAIALVTFLAGQNLELHQNRENAEEISQAIKRLLGDGT